MVTEVRETFIKWGFSANTSGISIYILGIDDKTYLSQTYRGKIGKASVTRYCIKFKALKDINIEELGEAIRGKICSSLETNKFLSKSNNNIKEMNNLKKN
ncbi:hypothetical protein [Chryseobacterium tongliaoense]|uniref:hypothetical protein n=1 Tax=Chryseobacterium tongliaoense TaxID=3240933 RepID=UPI00351299EF